MKNTERTLTPREAARALDVDTRTLAKWARHGKVPFTQTEGGHRRYRVSEVMSALQRAGESLPTVSEISSYAVD